MNYIPVCIEWHFFVQFNKCILYILPSVHSEPKDWVQMTLDIPPVYSFEWSSWANRRLSNPSWILPRHNYRTITRVRTGEREVSNLCTYGRKKKINIKMSAGYRANKMASSLGHSNGLQWMQKTAETLSEMTANDDSGTSKNQETTLIEKIQHSRPV